MARVFSLAAAIAALATAADPIRDITYNTSIERVAGIRFQRADKGFFIEVRGYVDLLFFGPDGELAYGKRPKLEHTDPGGIYSAAADTDGALAVSMVYKDADSRWAGAIVFFDPTGKQIHTVMTGRYMPERLCITPGNYLWTLGWQRYSQNDDWEEPDYPMLRRYTLDGQETGRFLGVKEFRWLASGTKGRHGWGTLQASGSKLGMTLMPDEEKRDWHWVEFDLEGKPAGKWNLGPGVGSVAFTLGGGLYTLGGGLTNNEQPYVKRFDRTTSSWDLLSQILPHRDIYGRLGYLMGADQNCIVVATPPAARLLWFPVE